MWVNSKVPGSSLGRRRSLFAWTRTEEQMQEAQASSNLMFWRTRRTRVEFLSWLYGSVAGLWGDPPKALLPFPWPVKSDPYQIIQGILFHQKMLVMWLRETGFTVPDCLCPPQPVHQIDSGNTTFISGEPNRPNQTRLTFGRQREGRITTFDLWNNQITGLKHVNQVFHY